MKIQLIMLSQPILISDEEYKNEDKQVFVINGVVHRVIAGIPELPTIDFSALSENDCKKIEWVDVEKLANELYPFAFGGIGNLENDKKNHFIKGFKTAKFLNEKKFSEGDVRKAIEMARKDDEVDGYYHLLEIIQSLSQPKIFDVEIEEEYSGSLCHKCNQISNHDNYDGEDCPSCHDYSTYTHIYEPKITNNSIKIIKIL